MNHLEVSRDDLLEAYWGQDCFGREISNEYRLKMFEEEEEDNIFFSFDISIADLFKIKIREGLFFILEKYI